MTEPTPDHAHEDLTSPPPPDGVLDAARAAALDAFDELHAGDSPGADAAPAVADLQARRDRRAAWARLPLGAVAAALVLVALVGVLVTQVDFEASDDDDSATAAFDETAGDASGDSSDDSADEESADALAPTESDDGAGGDDGAAFDAPAARQAYLDLDAFIADVRDAPTASTAEDDYGPGGATTTTAPGLGCDAVEVAGVDPGSVERVVPGTVAGEPLLAIVYAPSGASAGAERVAVVSESSCSLVDDRAL